MFNTDFFLQLEEFERSLGPRYQESRQVSEGDCIRYSPPTGMRVLECHEDINGEWVPNPVAQPKAR